MKLKPINKLKPLSSYNILRKRKRQKFNLRVRFVTFITLALLGSVLAAYGVDLLINFILTDLLGLGFQIPTVVDLIVISVSVGIFANYAISLWFMHPIKKMGKAISRIADGDFSARLSTRSSSQEVQELYSGFNLMAEQLSATEILQTDFVSNVSHEFKTPINAIEGYSMLLQDNDNLTEEQKEYVEKILFNTKRLSSLTGSILLLSKIENQTITTDKTNFRLDEQVREAIVALEPLWEAKNTDFDVEMDDIEYFGSETLLHHVWTNLIGNAIKFGPSEGTVRIRLLQKDKNIIFTVEDDGEGLSEEALKHIFDKFYQGDSSHKEEGNGLGLTLVKKILALEGGDISAENRAGGGCRFTVTLHQK